MSTSDNDPVQQQDGTQSQSWELEICEAAGISFAEADGQWGWCSPSGLWVPAKLGRLQPMPCYVCRKLSESHWEQLRDSTGGIARFATYAEAADAAELANCVRPCGRSRVSKEAQHEHR